MQYQSSGASVSHGFLLVSREARGTHRTGAGGPVTVCCVFSPLTSLVLPQAKSPRKSAPLACARYIRECIDCCLLPLQKYRGYLYFMQSTVTRHKHFPLLYQPGNQPQQGVNQYGHPSHFWIRDGREASCYVCTEEQNIQNSMH